MSKQKHKRRLKRIDQLELEYQETKRKYPEWGMSWKVSSILRSMLYMLDGSIIECGEHSVLSESCVYFNNWNREGSTISVSRSNNGITVRERLRVVEIIRTIRRKVKKDLLSCV